MSKYIKRNAKAIQARLINARSGNQGIEVEFKLDEPSPEGRTIMHWVGWLGANTIERTMKTLTDALGSNGSEEVNQLGIFTDPDFFDKDRTVTLSLGYDYFTNDDGKEIQVEKIMFVNSGGSKFESISKGEAKQVFANVGFKAAFLAAKKKANNDNPPPQTNTNEEVPF